MPDMDKMPDELRVMFQEVNELMAELVDIKKRRPLHRALSDLTDWLDKKLDRVCRLMDDIEYDIQAHFEQLEKEDAHEQRVAV